MAHIGPQILDNIFKGLDRALPSSATKGLVDILQSSDNIADDIAEWQSRTLDEAGSVMKRAELENLFKSPSFISRIEALPHIDDFYKSFDDAFGTSMDPIDVDAMITKLDVNTSLSQAEINAIKDGVATRLDNRASRIETYMDEMQASGQNVSYEDALQRDQAMFREAGRRIDARHAAENASSGGADAGASAKSARTVEEQAEALAKVEEDLKSKLNWKKIITGKMALGTASVSAVVGLKIYEHESGGAILDAAVDGVSWGIRELAEREIITPDNLESYVDKGTYILSVMNSFSKSLQNQAVKAAMDGADNPTEEQIENGKMAAAAWLIAPSNAAGLFVKHRVRLAVVDDVFDNKDDADKHLAEQLVQDIKGASHVNALGDNQVNEEDIKKAFVEAIENGGAIASMISGERVRNGLHQMWPDDFAAPGAVEVKDEAELDTGVAPQPLMALGGLAASSDGLANRDVVTSIPEVVRQRRAGGMSLTEQANAMNFGGVSLDSLGADVDDWSNDTVSKVFNAGGEALGMNMMKQAIFSVVSSLVVGVASMFGESAKVAAQRWVLDEFGVDDKVESLRGNMENNSVVSQFSDRFGVGQRGQDPELAL